MFCTTILLRSKHPAKGFTWIELIVVIAMMSILAAIGLPSMSKGYGSSGVSSQVAEISGLFESARSQAVKMNRNTCVQLRSYRSGWGEYEGKCVVEVYFVYPKDPGYTIKDCMESDFDTDQYMLGYKLYPDLNMTYESESTAGDVCTETEWRNFLFLGGNGFISQTQFNGQPWVSSIKEGKIVFKNPDDTNAEFWKMRVERSGVVSVE